jgi:hypothetical protein
MQSKGNVIDMTARRKQQIGSQNETVTGTAPVLDMTERRAEILNAERRQVKRTILTEFIGACVVIPNKGLAKVTLYDISDNGLAFDIESNNGRFKEGDEVAVRVYLNQQTYFGFLCTISNVRDIHEEGVIRHGGNFVKGTVNDVALRHFVKFIETISASLHKDSGDVMVSNLTR